MWRRWQVLFLTSGLLTSSAKAGWTLVAILQPQSPGTQNWLEAILWPWCGLYHSVAPMNKNYMTSVLRSCTQTSNESNMRQYDVEGCVRYSAVIIRPLQLSPLHLSKTCIYLGSVGPNPPAHTLTQQDPWSAGCKTYLVSEHQQASICDLIQHCSSAVSPYCIQPDSEGSQWPATYFALCRGWQKLS